MKLNWSEQQILDCSCGKVGKTEKNGDAGRQNTDQKNEKGTRIRIQLWLKEKGKERVKKVEFRYQPYFLLYLPDNHIYADMLEALASLYRVEESEFSSIYKKMHGYKVYCGHSELRRVAEKIEKQTRFRAELYNVDLRTDQRFLAEKFDGSPAYNLISDISFGAGSLGFGLSSSLAKRELGLNSGLSVLTMSIEGEKHYPAAINRPVKLKLDGETFLGDDLEIISRLAERIHDFNPDVILFPHADYWMQFLLRKAEEYDMDLNMSRDGCYQKLGSKSYFSYGRTIYRPLSFIPSGRILIDTENSFNYREGGLNGILFVSNLTGIPPNYTARFTPGTLISSYEVFEALKMGIAVPFRKRDAENLRKLEELKIVDRGGMVFQPEPGIYEDIYQLDFTSMYPSIIVKYNLSPEVFEEATDGMEVDVLIKKPLKLSGRKICVGTGKYNWKGVGEGTDAGSGIIDVVAQKRPGFLPVVLEPLLNLRIDIKRKKKENQELKGMDSILKWMLVTCFGYTGYRNARFGRIEVHEAINCIGRNIILKTKEIAESMGFDVLHGIVDCLWVRGAGIQELKDSVEKETGLLTDVEHYNWIVFLPMSDKSGSYNSYYGRLDNGEFKVRGVAFRRADTPEYLKNMQGKIFDELSKVEIVKDIPRDKILSIYEDFKGRLECGDVDPKLLAIYKRISKLEYSRRCPEASAVREYKKNGADIYPGTSIGFVVKDAGRWSVDVPWNAESYDRDYYLRLLDKVWSEIFFLFSFRSKYSKGSV